MRRAGNATGLGVDYTGGPVVDPTENVKALMAASLEALAQLRISDNAFNDAAARHLTEITTLRANHAKELSALRERHQEALRVAEAARIDSIRQVDREEVNKTAAQALQAINTLAATAAQTAETLRNQVATVALQATTQRATDAAETNKRLSALELSSSERAGKQTVVDPQLAELVAEMKLVSKTLATGGGKSEGMEKLWGWISAVFIAAVAVVGLYLRT